MVGIISYYDKLCSYKKEVKQPTVVKSPEEVFTSIPLEEDAMLITLAETDPYTKDIITAHRMKDYRRRDFNLVLLPEIDILFDKILEGSEYWNELLHPQSKNL